jgi:hypothetical protein
MSCLHTGEERGLDKVCDAHLVSPTVTTTL